MTCPTSDPKELLELGLAYLVVFPQTLPKDFEGLQCALCNRDILKHDGQHSHDGSCRAEAIVELSVAVGEWAKLPDCDHLYPPDEECGTCNQERTMAEDRILGAHAALAAGWPVGEGEGGG